MWNGAESNRRHLGLQPSALPTELPFLIFCGESKNRTCGTWIFSPLLYLLSYHTILLVFPSCQPSMCHSAYASVVRQDFVVKTGLEPVVKDKRLVLLQGLGIMSIPTFNTPLRTPIPPPDYSYYFDFTYV